MVDEGSDKAIFFGHLAPHPHFESGYDSLAATARLRCIFPQAGHYTAQVWFYQEYISDVLKAEVPLLVADQGD